MEFALVGDEVKIYHVDEDGSLIAFAPEAGAAVPEENPIVFSELR
ncbi:hypothetical protein [Sulfoacidibacillus thermotolerans]|nr:hypothetical protein [Sulfoacidibacillus thermotolerans]